DPRTPRSPTAARPGAGSARRPPRRGARRPRRGGAVDRRVRRGPCRRRPRGPPRARAPARPRTARDRGARTRRATDGRGALPGGRAPSGRGPRGARRRRRRPAHEPAPDGLRPRTDPAARRGRRAGRRDRLPSRGVARRPAPARPPPPGRPGAAGGVLRGRPHRPRQHLAGADPGPAGAAPRRHRRSARRAGDRRRGRVLAGFLDLAWPDDGCGFQVGRPRGEALARTGRLGELGWFVQLIPDHGRPDWLVFQALGLLERRRGRVPPPRV
ncbi:MAG: hypothetical protein AVDCRST_MAG54-2267, partial [uncultured Actinomycetospora sp.]